MLDTYSLKLALGVVTLTLCCLFFGSFRRSQSAYTGWWCLALAFWLFGNGAFMLAGTPHQMWANPLGNALLVGGAFCVWAGTRSLRLLTTPWWQLAAAPTLTACAAILGDPAENAWSGGLVYLAMMGAGMALAARELALLKRTESTAHRPLQLAAIVLVGYFLARGAVYVVDGPHGQGFRTYFSPSVTCILLIVLLIIVSFSMTELSNKQLISSLTERATQDGLTGLLNREGFTELANRELRRLRGAGSVTALILADLDHFKTINDTYGHAAGDAAIRAFAKASVASVRSTDLVGRYGGEEFIILLTGVDHFRAQSITTEISRRLSEMTPVHGTAFPTVSYGIACGAGMHDELAPMIAEADAALYKAKAAGRNRAVSTTPDLEVLHAPQSSSYGEVAETRTS
ncbi:GGDEF domain-containing protein [Paenarthrobacter sp. NPDC092416]|uniref:GGDEF domain-containing protein n=1 Tax=Paenarthrobacter sp. NPDC092416 TaxID=3364386 RepID=UPI00381B89CA